jgi:hypothetical protein
MAEATIITQFRLINLINYSFITKILACRLAKVLDQLISPTQTAFIRGKNSKSNVPLCESDVHI